MPQNLAHGVRLAGVGDTDSVQLAAGVAYKATEGIHDGLVGEPSATAGGVSSDVDLTIYNFFYDTDVGVTTTLSGVRSTTVDNVAGSQLVERHDLTTSADELLGEVVGAGIGFHFHTSTLQDFRYGCGASEASALDGGCKLGPHSATITVSRSGNDTIGVTGVVEALTAALGGGCSQLPLVAGSAHVVLVADILHVFGVRHATEVEGEGDLTGVDVLAAIHIGDVLRVLVDEVIGGHFLDAFAKGCLLYTSPSPRD